MNPYRDRYTFGSQDTTANSQPEIFDIILFLLDFVDDTWYWREYNHSVEKLKQTNTKIFRVHFIPLFNM